MELSRKDAFLVMRAAYKSGLMSKLTNGPVPPAVHVPGTSYLDTPNANPLLDLVNIETYGKFLAQLIDDVRKERDDG